MHALSGHYISVLLEHYYCHRVWISDTKSARTSNTVFFKHKYLTMLTVTPADALMTAVGNLCEAIDGRIPQSQSDKAIVETFMAILNAYAKSRQRQDKLQQRVQSYNAAEQRMTADSSKNTKDA